MADEPVLARGDSGEWVSFLQGRLALHGYSPGATDGEFGPRTEREVLQFQSDKELPVDGRVGPLTWEVLLGEPAFVPEAFDRPGDEAEDLSLIDQGEAESLAGQIASAFGIASGFGLETLITDLLGAEPAGGEDVRARCGAKCDLILNFDGEVFALTDCGDGTCPTCPPGLGNLIVKNWCAYVSVPSQRAAIVLHLAFGARIGPFLV